MSETEAQKRLVEISADRIDQLNDKLIAAEASLAAVTADRDRMVEALRTADYRMCVMENSPNLNEGEKELFRQWIAETRAALTSTEDRT